MKILIQSIVLLFFMQQLMAQETYYVAIDGNNNNGGTLDLPFRDIQYGVDQLTAGDTLVVTNGRYFEIINIDGLNLNGTSNNPLKLIAESNVIIDASNHLPSGRQGIITLNNVNYVTINGFELAHFKTADGLAINDTPIGILLQGNSSNISIINNKIHNIQNRSSCGQSSGCGVGANGIGIYGNTPTGITDIELINNEVYQCVLAASEAFTINGNVNRFKVFNNYIHDNNNIGFDFIGYEDDTCEDCDNEVNRVRNGYVKGNRAINNSIKLALGGFDSNPWYEDDGGNASGFYVDGGKNIVFDGNYSSKNDLGFAFASEHPGKSTEDILMINNFIYLNREVGITVGGYAESSVGEGGGNAMRIKIINNSFYKNQGCGTEVFFAYRVHDFIASNNIFYGTTDIANNYYQEPNGQHQNIIWMNNIWWAINNSGADGLPENAPIVIDPQYIDPANGNLRLHMNSPSIDNGVRHIDINDWSSPIWLDIFSSHVIPVHGYFDINGENRIENTMIDIGADEYNSDSIFANGFE